MSDLIDKDMAIAAIRKALNGLPMAVMTLPSAQPTPCDVCRHNPPSSMDGKTCCVCPAERITDG